MLFKTKNASYKMAPPDKNIDRKWLKISLVFHVVLLLSIIGCIPFFGDSESLPFTTISTSRWHEMRDYPHYGGLGYPANMVIKTEVEWEALWQEMTQGHYDPEPELPPVDFDNYMVIGVFLGTTSYGNISVKITEIEETKDSIIVHYEIHEPGPGVGWLFVLGAPNHIVKVKLSDKDVVFMKRKKPVYDDSIG